MREEKQLLLDEVQNKMNASNAFIITKYNNLGSNVSASFRGEIIKAGGELEVVKKRIFLKACQEAGFDIKHADLDGHIALILGYEDPVGMTKSAFKFAKESGGLLEFLLGKFEGKLVSKEDLKQLSKLPSKDEMRAELLGLFTAPMSQTLAVFEALLTSVIHCLDQKSQQGEGS